ncbi:hypothetical protein GCM10027447_21200 [Glycomyces halotolerans]
MEGVMLPDVGRIVTPDGVVNGALVVEGDRIAAVEERDGDPSGWVLPGFVDVHCHGGGGYSLADGDADAARSAAAFHASRGTTSLVASLVSSPHEDMLSATRALAPLVAEGTLVGVHCEGPYISAAKCGAHVVEALRDPDLGELAELLEAGEGAVKMVTIAPELPGAVEAIEFLDSRGVVASIGHTDASYEQTEAGIDAGAQSATHLFNAMRGFDHRDPGPVPALIADERIFSEIIADGVHLHPGTMRFAFDVSLPGWTMLVSDAMDAAGLEDGSYRLGRHEVEVREGVARVAGTDTIAGSTITLLDAVRNAVQLAGRSVAAAAQMAATTPAELLGLEDVGAIEPGRFADAVVLDDELRLVSVMRRGAWLRVLERRGRVVVAVAAGADEDVDQAEGEERDDAEDESGDGRFAVGRFAFVRAAPPDGAEDDGEDAERPGEEVEAGDEGQADGDDAAHEAGQAHAVAGFAAGDGPVAAVGRWGRHRAARVRARRGAAAGRVGVAGRARGGRVLRGHGVLLNGVAPKRSCPARYCIAGPDVPFRPIAVPPKAPAPSPLSGVRIFCRMGFTTGEYAGRNELRIPKDYPGTRSPQTGGIRAQPPSTHVRHEPSGGTAGPAPRSRTPLKRFHAW